MVRLHQLLHEARFADPTGDHLSPAGEYNLRLGVMKELHPELIATHQGEVKCEAKCGRGWTGRRTRGGRGDSSRSLLCNQLVLACITFCAPSARLLHPCEPTFLNQQVTYACVRAVRSSWRLLSALITPWHSPASYNEQATCACLRAAPSLWRW